MDRQELIDEVRDAMCDVQDMDTQLRDYARAAVDHLGWRTTSKALPDFGDLVVCTDGEARWLDTRHKYAPDLKFWTSGKEHIATHWHPVQLFASNAKTGE